MRVIKFEERAVAFLDVSGFKQLVHQAQADDVSRKRLSVLLRKLQSNRNLNAIVKRNVPKEMRPKSLEISDSIVLQRQWPLRDIPTTGAFQF